VKKYNKVYFLHIPKTGGRFFVKYILNPMEDVLKENNIEIIKEIKDGFPHSGWHKDIDDNTYIITLFRDPAEFFISAISHLVYESAGLLDDGVVKKDSPILDIKKETLYKELEKFKILQNFQSQNFILSPKNQIDIVKESVNYYLKNKSFNNELAYERVKRVNLMIRQKDLKTMNYLKLIKKISEDLGIDINIDLSNIDKENFKNNSSELLFSKLTKEDLEIIYNNFLFDKKIYEDDSLFWNS
jgi:hypothetical protein